MVRMRPCLRDSVILGQVRDASLNLTTRGLATFPTFGVRRDKISEKWPFPRERSRGPGRGAFLVGRTLSHASGTPARWGIRGSIIQQDWTEWTQWTGSADK